MSKFSSRHLFAYSSWDAVPVVLGLAHFAWLLCFFHFFPLWPWWAVLLAGAFHALTISWNINSVAHNSKLEHHFRPKEHWTKMSQLRSRIQGEQQRAGTRVIKPPHALGFLDPGPMVPRTPAHVTH